MYKSSESLQESIILVNNQIQQQHSAIEEIKIEILKTTRLLLKVIDILKDEDIIRSNVISFPGPGHKLNDD